VEPGGSGVWEKATGLTPPQIRDILRSVYREEILATKSKPNSFMFTPLQVLGRTSSFEHYGSADSEVFLPDGFGVYIKVNGERIPGEIVASDDFGLVLSCSIRLPIGTQVAIEFDSSWLVQAFDDWVRSDWNNPSRQEMQLALELLNSQVKQKEEEIRVSRRAKQLNAEQQEAIRRASREPVTFLWGPPGTGKTHTLSAIVTKCLLDKESVLFVAQTNMAIDTLMKSVIRKSSLQELIKDHWIIRWGRPRMQPFEQWDPVLATRIAENANPVLAARRRFLMEQRNQIMEQLRRGSSSGRQSLSQITDELRRIEEYFTKMAHQLVDNANLVAATLTSLALHEVLRDGRYDVVVIDEASMASIAYVLPAACLAISRLVICGDFRQLSPIHNSESARAKRWLGESPFESSSIQETVTANRHDSRLIMLKQQYRMHPSIANVVDQYIYGGRLRDHETTYGHTLPSHVPFNNPLVMVDLTNLNPRCRKELTGNSRWNETSAKVVEACLDLYRECDLSIGIITPYRQQAKTIRDRLPDDLVTGDRVRVSTVHKFQGSERDVVFFDVTDSFPMKAPGVLISGSSLDSQSARLINVAVTRAKRQFVMFVDLRFVESRLGRDSVLRRVIEHIKRMGMVIDAETMTPISNTNKWAFPKIAATSSDNAAVEGVPRKRRWAKRGEIRCNSCQSPLVVRQGWSLFLGCSAYPSCRSTRPLGHQELIEVLSTYDIRCPCCEGVLTGDLSNNRKGNVKLECLECGKQFPKSESARILLDGSRSVRM